VSVEVAVPEPDAHTLVAPGTGEVLAIETADEAVAALDYLRTLESDISLAKRHATERLTELALLYGKNTMPVSGGRKVSLSTGTSTTYDADAIYAALIDAGMPEERIEEIIETTVTHRVRAAQAKQAAGANPAYREIIEKHTTVHERPRYASVTRAG
jgi:hypothetical protein